MKTIKAYNKTKDEGKLFYPFLKFGQDKYIHSIYQTTAYEKFAKLCK
jgi:hypothetical protein